MCEPVLVVHGGAWAVPDHLAQASRRGVTQAAFTGHKLLMGGGTALEAVIASVKVRTAKDLDKESASKSFQKFRV